MAQTKLDLSNSKFEQLSSEALHLSGCTYVFGQFKLESGSTLSILSNAGAGKVLTSDVNGTTTWQTSTGGGTITGATNGLGITGKKICLGGNLAASTTINTGSYNLCFDGNAGITTIKKGFIILISTGSTNICSTGYVNIGSATTPDLTICSNNSITNCSCNFILDWSGGTGMIYDSNATPRGLQYGADYSANYTNRSLVDKGFLSTVTGVTNVTVTNGLNKNSGSAIGLGGTLTGNTCIDLGINAYSLLLSTDVSEICGCEAKINIDGNPIGNPYVVISSRNNTLDYSGSVTFSGGTVKISATGNNFPGVVYDKDYSVDFTAHSLVDAAYVTGQTGGGGITGATNGLIKTGKNVVLGGNLTGSTSIDLCSNSLAICANNDSAQLNIELCNTANSCSGRLNMSAGDASLSSTSSSGGSRAASIEVYTDITSACVILNVNSGSSQSMLCLDPTRITLSGNVEVVYGSANYLYLGEKDTDGSWRFAVCGADLRFERRITGVWTCKGSFAG